MPAPPSLATVAREWGHIGLLGFGGPPAHVALLRALCVEREGWLDDEQFERAIAATSLLPGPGSTQLAIYCAWRLRGRIGAVVGGVCFVAPAVVLILGLSLVFLSSSPPRWLRAAGTGAGAAVPAVALYAGAALVGPMWRRGDPPARGRLVLYAAASALAAATAGGWLVLVLLGCGALELVRGGRDRGSTLGLQAWPGVLALAPAGGGLAALAWTALKVGGLAFGGGFVIVPLMQSDAVHTYHWMTDGQFLDAVALGQVTPGPIVATVAAVGYAAFGIGGGLLASLIAFAPSFSFVLIGAQRFERLTASPGARDFLAGAAPAATGAILGSSVPLAGALTEPWEGVLLAGAVVLLFWLRWSVVSSLLASAGLGILLVVAGAPLGPR